MPCIRVSVRLFPTRQDFLGFGNLLVSGKEKRSAQKWCDWFPKKPPFGKRISQLLKRGFEKNGIQFKILECFAIHFPAMEPHRLESQH